MALYNSASGSSSSFYFGNLNPSYATSDSQLTWTSLYSSSSTSNWWTVPIASINVGGKAISTVANNGIIDSGTSLILMTNDDYATW